MIKIVYPSYHENIEEIVNFLTFSGGEEHVRLTKQRIGNGHIIIKARIKDSKGIMQLLLVTDALKNMYNNPIKLILPYIPYARQDRVCVEGNAFSLRVFADIINSQGYCEVVVADAHSDTAIALIDRCINIPQWVLAKELQAILPQVDTIISPDAGASKKTYALWEDWGDTLYVQALKVRNKTGNIVKTEIHEHNLIGKTCLIVDDICDGGRTFIELAKAMKEKGTDNIYLYVTHGIFSGGIIPLQQAGIKKIFTTDSLLDNSNHTSLEIIHRFF